MQTADSSMTAHAQQQQQQQQQQRRGQGQVRNRDDAAARQMLRVNLGHAAAEGAAAQPPSTPAASEPPRAFSGEASHIAKSNIAAVVICVCKHSVLRC